MRLLILLFLFISPITSYAAMDMYAVDKGNDVSVVYYNTEANDTLDDVLRDAGLDQYPKTKITNATRS